MQSINEIKEIFGDWFNANKRYRNLQKAEKNEIKNKITGKFSKRIAVESFVIMVEFTLILLLNYIFGSLGFYIGVIPTFLFHDAWTYLFIYRKRLHQHFKEIA